METARQLGYPGPDPLAQGLRRGRAGAIGLIHDTQLSYAVRDPAFLPFLGGVGDAVESAGSRLLLISGSAPSERDRTVISNALVDGLIVYSVAEGDPLVSAALERRIPIVIVDQPSVSGVPLVGIDDRGAAREVARHVLGLGHRDVAVISLPLLPDGRRGPADEGRQARSSYPIHRARLAGYSDAVAEAGLAWSRTPVHECAGSTMAAGYAAALALLDGGAPTAILAMSDQLALGAIEAARERGLAVPRRLSVVGFDNTPEAAIEAHRLTTVDQPHSRKGSLAAEVLLTALGGDPLPAGEPLAHRLVVRDSTAPPGPRVR